MKKEVNVAILGFGVVGQGTYKVLAENADLIEKRIGARVKVKRIVEINTARYDTPGVPREVFTPDYSDVLNDPDIDIVVEMIGGVELASRFMLQALERGKHVVSSNKAALAVNIRKMNETAKANGCMLRYEASVCGAIPVMNALSTSLSVNNIKSIRGIVNGTSNYILTKMEEEGLAYDVALRQAQENGFAEQDPTGDVEGFDSANKIVLLAAIAYGEYVPPEEVDRTGISGITPADIEAAREKNCRIRLIAGARREDGKLRLSVKPELIPCDDILASVRNEFNGITITGDMSGDIFFYGRGAGSVPTGAAVAGDVAEIAACVARDTHRVAIATSRV